MAAGAPVVAAKARAIPEFVMEGETGYLFQPGNINEFAEKLLLAMGNEGMRKKCREHARRYSIEKMAERLVDFYARVANKN